MAGEAGQDDLVTTQIELIASRAEAVAHKLRAQSGRVTAAEAREVIDSSSPLAHELAEASANLNALAAPMRQLPAMERLSQR